LARTLRLEARLGPSTALKELLQARLVYGASESSDPALWVNATDWELLPPPVIRGWLVIYTDQLIDVEVQVSRMLFLFVTASGVRVHRCRAAVAAGALRHAC
jgi:hypothetical protein